MKRKWTLWKVMVQVVGFAVGLGLFAWCVSLALRPQNRESIERLMSAPVWVFAALLACAALSLVCNGTMFWLLMRPVRRVGWLSVASVNAVATSLNYLPFKLSVLSRFVIHNRRDGLPVTLILAWLGAAGVVILGAIAPPIAATMVRTKVDGWWWVMAVAGVAIGAASVVLVARWVKGCRAESALGRLREWRPVKAMSPGLVMLSDGWGVWGSFGVRSVDIALVAARFWLAAQACGTPISLGTALLAASTYFLIGMVTPSGALGAREGGATLLAGSILHLPDVANESFAVVALVASASEMIVNLIAAGVSGIYLRFSESPESACVVPRSEG